MLDNIISVSNIIKNKKFKVKIFEIYSKLSLSFLRDFSQELRKDKEVQKYPNLIYLMFWCNNLLNSIKRDNNEFLRLGRGLAFHICPSNVPTNFIYSFLFGLLSGNSNIVKMPSKKFKEKNIILSIIKKLFKKNFYKDLRNSNSFIQYSDKDEATKKLSAISDVRIIWGGDKTINDVRKNWIPEKAIDVTFADRYSFSLINIDKLKKESNTRLFSIVKNFYYDGYMMNQMACNSPHFVFWLGKKDLRFQNKFWSILSNIVDKKFTFDEVHAVDKYSNLMENIIKNQNFLDIKRIKNNVFVVTPNSKLKNIEEIRGVNGIFFQKNIKNILMLKFFISKKCQTISYYGVSKNEFKEFLSKNNLFGVDRIVPLGQALEIDLIWDGYDVIKSLSRVISFK